MRKNIKYSVSSIIIMLSLVLGFVAHAEDNTNGIGGDIRSIKAEIEAKNAAYKNKMEQELQQIKTQRDEFQSQLEAKKAEVKLKIEEIKTTFKDKIAKIKDEKKKASAEIIVSKLNELNLNRTSELADKLNQIENVLVSIRSRISKAENKILDVSTLSAKQSAADAAITAAKVAITKQASLSYTVSSTIADEASLKKEMQKLRDSFNTDIKALNATVKAAHTAVKELATTLAKVPKVDEDEGTKAVDNTNTTGTN